MRQFFRSTIQLSQDVLKYIWVWGPFVAFDLLDTYETYIRPNISDDWRQRLMWLLPDKVPYLIAGLFGVSILVAYHKLRLKLPENLDGDMTIKESVDYIVNDSVADIERIRPYTDNKGNTVYIDGGEHLDAKILINNAANAGKLQIFGQRDKFPPGIGHVFEASNRPIPVEFWSSSEIDAVVLYDPKGRQQTSPLDINDRQTNQYTNLRVSKKQLTQVWPKKSLWRRCVDALFGNTRIVFPAERKGCK